MSEGKNRAIGQKIWSPGEPALRESLPGLRPGDRDIYVREQDVISS